MQVLPGPQASLSLFPPLDEAKGAAPAQGYSGTVDPEDPTPNPVPHSALPGPQVFEFGHTNRTTEFTNLNEHSSRSHALLIVTVHGVDGSTGLRTTGE